ncbi:glycosyltransferase family 8 protein [Enterococcus innesii]
MKLNQNINIVFVTDNNYCEPLLVTVASIIARTKSKLQILILTNDEISYKYSEKIIFFNKKPNVSVSLMKIEDEQIKKFTAKNHVSQSAFIKVLLPQILHFWDDCIYLDGDLLFLKDVKNLWELKNSDFSIQAVRAANYTQDHKFLGLKDEEETFNTGVMILNLNKMRRENSTDKLIDFLIKYNSRTLLNDQAAFNAIFKDDWDKLDMKWNVFVQNFIHGSKYLNYSQKEIQESRKNPYIVHFNGAIKPWFKYSGHAYKKNYVDIYKDLYHTFPSKQNNQNIWSFVVEKFGFFKGKIKLFFRM